MQQSTNPPTALVVEDDLVILAFLTTFLSQHGYRVIACESLASASHALPVGAPYASAFIDGHLGGSSIREMLAFIRALTPHVRGPLVAMSSDPEVREAQLRAGCSHASEKSGIVELLKHPDFQART